MCVFAFFEARDLHNFLCCNKHFHRIASDDFLWRSLLTAELGAEHLPGSDPGSGGWRRRFWQWHRLESCLCSPKRQPKPSPTVRASHIHLHACRPGLRTTLTHTLPLLSRSHASSTARHAARAIPADGSTSLAAAARPASTMTYGYSTSSMRVATRCCVAHPLRHPPPPPPPPSPESRRRRRPPPRLPPPRRAPSQRARGGISPPPTLRHSANHPPSPPSATAYSCLAADRAMSPS